MRARIDEVHYVLTPSKDGSATHRKKKIAALLKIFARDERVTQKNVTE
jgi:hypothetical protein